LTSRSVATPTTIGHGIVTRDAGLLPPNHYLAVAIDYLYRNRPHWKKDSAVGKTVVKQWNHRPRGGASGSQALRSAGRLQMVRGRPARRLARIWPARRALARHSCASTAAPWSTDKDGIAAALLSAEITAKSGRDPGVLYRELTGDLGEPAADRVEARATPEQKAVLAKLSPEQVKHTEARGEKIERLLTPRAGQ